MHTSIHYCYTARTSLHPIDSSLWLRHLLEVLLSICLAGLLAILLVVLVSLLVYSLSSTGLWVYSITSACIGLPPHYNTCTCPTTLLMGYLYLLVGILLAIGISISRWTHRLGYLISWGILLPVSVLVIIYWLIVYSSLLMLYWIATTLHASLFVLLHAYRDIVLLVPYYLLADYHLLEVANYLWEVTNSLLDIY